MQRRCFYLLTRVSPRMLTAPRLVLTLCRLWISSLTGPRGILAWALRCTALASWTRRVASWAHNASVCFLTVRSMYVGHCRVPEGPAAGARKREPKGWAGRGARSEGTEQSFLCPPDTPPWSWLTRCVAIITLYFQSRAADTSGAAGVGNLFKQPDALAKIATHPTTAAYLQQPDFVSMLTVRG